MGTNGGKITDLGSTLEEELRPSAPGDQTGPAVAQEVGEQQTERPQSETARDRDREEVHPPAVEYYATIYPGPEKPIPEELGKRLEALGAALGAPVWALIQQHPHHGPQYGGLSYELRDAFYRQRAAMKACGPAALVIESPGGYARVAYQIATLFRRHCGGFVAVVPAVAKSAATLLSLGATDIYLGFDAELGPLDAQLHDPEREEIGSALNEVSALERLHSVALDQFDQTMMLLISRTQKKVETLLPLALKFTAEMMAPLLDKIDTVHYTQQSRVLKEAEDYASRLLQPRYAPDRADKIARRLVNNYSDHGFVIDRDEADSFLDFPTPTEGQMAAIGALEDYLTDSEVLVIGRLEKKEKGGEAVAGD